MAEPKVTPFLWYAGDVQKVAQFYQGVFGKKDAKIVDSNAMSATMKIRGQSLILFAGGPGFQFSPAVSLMVQCKTQKQIDRYWKGLLAGGGRPNQCGWLQDKYGLSWQVTPEILPDLLMSKDEAACGRAHDAMMKMKKFDLAQLKKAYAGR